MRNAAIQRNPSSLLLALANVRDQVWGVGYLILGHGFDGPDRSGHPLVFCVVGLCQLGFFFFLRRSLLGFRWSRDYFKLLVSYLMHTF